MSINKYIYIFTIIMFFSLYQKGYAYVRGIDSVDIISRTDRGADESRRLSSNPGYDGIRAGNARRAKELETLKTTNFDAWLKRQQDTYESQKKSTMRDNFLVGSFPNKFNSDRIVTSIAGGNLWWSDKYKDKKTQILIHHTAGRVPAQVNYDQEKQMIQDIYKFHTFTRGWGDIGYNFLIGPSGRIYEGKAGGPGIIGSHSVYNNTESIGISLLGNFDVDTVPAPQRRSLVALTQALAQKYNIQPTTTTTYHKSSTQEPYAINAPGLAIAGHKDAGRTACPGNNVYTRLDELRTLVAKTNTIPKPIVTNGLSSQMQQQRKSVLFSDTIQKFAEQQKLAWSAQNISKQASPIDKLSKAPSVSQALVGNDLVRVLLMELSRDYTTLVLDCKRCTVYLNGATKGQVIGDRFTIIKTTNSLVWQMNNKAIRLQSIRIENNNPSGLITISNYTRTSFAGIPWNTFRGSIEIKQETYRPNPSSNEFIKGFVVINQLDLDSYLQGIVETNDQESLEKNKVMALLTKNYILYYMYGSENHPSIPAGSSYNSIDDPDYFQKYAGAGVEKTLTKRPQALEATKNTHIIYNDKIAILPYFTCSPGFTLSANEKRGRQDTPYLATLYDFGPCEGFSGHGVGMSGRGAEELAKRGLSYQDIIQYYYRGVEIIKK